MTRFKHFIDGEEGQDMIEYALVAALIGLGAITTLKGVSDSIKNAFNSIGTTLSTSV